MDALSIEIRENSRIEVLVGRLIGAVPPRCFLHWAPLYDDLKRWLGKPLSLEYVPVKPADFGVGLSESPIERNEAYLQALLPPFIRLARHAMSIGAPIRRWDVYARQLHLLILTHAHPCVPQLNGGSFA